MAGPSTSRLFKPLKVGKMQLQHRITMCPMTRCRIMGDHVPQTQVVKEYYKQRACVPGTLIVSEGILASKQMAGGFPSPGIWSQEQISAWKEITEEVHRQGCFIVAQLFGFGRAASEEGCRQEGFDLVGPSAIPIDPNHPTPRAMTLAEIEQTVADFAQASRNAIEAGFDGVECHGANGYLLNQFLQEVSNQRDDQYGGSIENRSRLIVEVLEVMIEAVGADRVGLRLSPFSPFQGMAVPDPYPQPTHLIRKASELGLMYLSMVEGRISGSSEGELDGDLDFAYQLWNGPFIAAGGYTTEKAKRLVDQERTGSDIIVGFGRSYVSNPDLVYRVARDIPLTKYDRSTFYTATSEGYTDYPASKDFGLSIGVPS
ncbi:FMN-linked oxidoreductase [Sarocladium strictum]